MKGKDKSLLSVLPGDPLVPGNQLSENMRFAAQTKLYSWGFKLSESSGAAKTMHQFGGEAADNGGAWNDGVWIVKPVSKKEGEDERSKLRDWLKKKDDTKGLKCVDAQSKSANNPFLPQDLKTDPFLVGRYCDTQRKSSAYTSLIFAQHPYMEEGEEESERVLTSYRQTVDLTNHMPYVMKIGRGPYVTAPTECMMTQVVRGERVFPHRKNQKHSQKLVGPRPTGHPETCPTACSPARMAATLSGIFGPSRSVQAGRCRRGVACVADLEKSGRDQVCARGDSLRERNRRWLAVLCFLPLIAFATTPKTQKIAFFPQFYSCHGGIEARLGEGNYKGLEFYTIQGTTTFVSALNKMYYAPNVRVDESLDETRQRCLEYPMTKIANLKGFLEEFWHRRSGQHKIERKAPVAVLRITRDVMAVHHLFRSLLYDLHGRERISIETCVTTTFQLVRCRLQWYRTTAKESSFTPAT